MFDGRWTNDLYTDLVGLGIVIGVVVVIVIWSITAIFKGQNCNSIRTDRPILPRLEVVIEEGEVDTTYVYQFQH